MATESAHIDLELASGRNEVTAPFHQTAQRRRHSPSEQLDGAAVANPPADARVQIDVPFDAPAGNADAAISRPAQAETTAHPRIGRPNWITVIGATAAVAAAVWWVMFQRLPDIDPREVIQRNLGDARSAMAEGRYTDPSERSAFHYYTTVLALDPDNKDAIAGIDAIADRHLTDARVLLSERRIAEAGVAIEKARRVRPHHSSLPGLDSQWRAELRKILATSAVPLPSIEPAQEKVARAPNVLPARAEASRPSSAPTAKAPVESAPPALRVKELPVLTLARNDVKETSLITPAASEPSPVDSGASGSAPVVDEPVNATAAAAAPLPESTPALEAAIPAVAPKLIKMVQPEYPQEAVMRGIEGWVDVSLEVNAAGDVIAPRVENTSRGRIFNRAALTAIQQWKYEPRTGNTSERVRVRLQFRQSR